MYNNLKKIKIKILNDRCGSTSGKEYHLKGNREETKIQENCALLGYYPASGLKAILGFLTLEVRTDRLCRNVFEGISTTRCVIAQKSVFLNYLAPEA